MEHGTSNRPDFTALDFAVRGHDDAFRSTQLRAVGSYDPEHATGEARSVT